MGKLSKSELKEFKEQEQKKQAILTRFRFIGYTVTYTISYVCRTFNEARKEQERT
jgi:hypothetical protein